jgi:hypothetical protein
MAEIEMPPEYAGSYDDPKDTSGRVIEALRTQASNRINTWATLVQSAVSQFEEKAGVHIDQLEYEDEATYAFAPVVVSVVKALVEHLPLAKKTEEGATLVMSAVEIIESMQDAYDQNLESDLTGAKRKLKASVAALALAARQKTDAALSNMQNQVPQAAKDAMSGVDSVSTDPDYVSALCDWMGCPAPTPENTGYPVRQSLENPFFGIYVGVRAQLLRAQGVAGLDDDDLDPIKWEHDGIVRQQEIYDGHDDLEKPKAWDESYAEIPPLKA